MFGKLALYKAKFFGLRGEVVFGKTGLVEDRKQNNFRPQEGHDLFSGSPDSYRNLIPHKP